MAYMGAMLIGMVAGGIMMAVLGTVTLVLGIAVFIDSRRHGMKTGWWIVAVLICSVYTIVPYVAVRVKKAHRKCGTCSSKAGENDSYCESCGSKLKEINDAGVAKIFIVVVWAASVIAMIASELITALTH